MLKGNIDKIGHDFAYGWFCDDACYEKRLPVAIAYGDEVIARGMADRFRGDLRKAHEPGEYCFYITFDLVDDPLKLNVIVEDAAGARHVWPAKSGVLPYSRQKFGEARRKAPEKLKWLCRLNEAELRFKGACLLAAIHSCLANTTLEPHLLYSGQPNQFTKYLESLGVAIDEWIFPHTSPDAQIKGSAEKLSADLAFLDLPLIEKSDDIVLYTDVNVLFKSDPKFEAAPHILAAPASHCDPYAACSTGLDLGIMLLNLRGLRLLREPMLEYLSSTAGNGLSVAHGISAFLESIMDILPPQYNHSPFQPSVALPVIVHYADMAQKPGPKASGAPTEMSSLLERILTPYLPPDSLLILESLY